MALVQSDQRLIFSHMRPEVEAMVRAYRARKLPVTFDIETTGLDPRNGKLVTLQFQQEGQMAVVFDVRGHKRNLLAQSLAPLFDGSVLIIGHNLKFDIAWMMEQLGIYPKRLFDTLLAEQVIYGLGRSDAKGRGLGLGLKDLSQRYLKTEMSKVERSYFIDLDQRPEWDQPIPREQVEYAATDVTVLHAIYQEQLELLSSRQLTTVAKLEMRTLPALTMMELSGIRVNVEGWRAFIAEKAAESQKIESQALEVFGAAILSARTKVYDEKLVVWQKWDGWRQEQEVVARDRWDYDKDHGVEQEPWGKFKVRWMQEWREANPNPGKPKPDTSMPNLASPAQLMQAFEEMGIIINSTASEVLERLEDEHPEVKLLLDYRRTAKFVTSFGESLLQFVTPEGRIHPEYVQIGASTGRMSCTRPNWQQVPSKGDGARLRQLVIASPGCKLLTADFSNIELRILAELSGDEVMLGLFARGEDLHSATARMMFGLGRDVDVKHVLMPGSDQTYRAVAKTINFGLVYGMSPNKLARTLHIDKGRAQELMEQYFNLYPGVRTWLDEVAEEGKRTLRSVTLSGRKRFYTIPPMPPYPRGGTQEQIDKWWAAKSEWRGVLGRIERQSKNTPIQGTSADMTKLAMALWYEIITHPDNAGTDCSGARIVAVVHDEIVVEAPEWATKQVSTLLADVMGRAAKTYLKTVHVPPVDVAVGDYWKKE